MVAAAAPATPPVLHVPPAHVSASTSAPHGWTGYRVRSGDTLEVIAARFRTTTGTLTARNHLRDPDVIHAGMRLAVPRLAAPRATPHASTTRSTAVHVVRSGETLSGIAARYKVSLASLLKANRLSTRSVLQIGQRVVVRGVTHTVRAHRATKPRTPAASTRGITVRSGDTLSGIAARYGTTVAAVARASRISAGSVLHVGQRLRVPVRSSSSASSVPDTFSGVRYPQPVAQAAARNRARLAAASVPSRTEVKRLVAATARRHGVDVRLALAISFQESGWNQRAVSPANAVGVMQVIPAAGDWASSLVGRRLDLLDTRDNITAGVVMLRALGRSTSSMQNTVAAYYQGLGALQQHGMYADTTQYVRSVMALRARM